MLAGEAANEALTVGVPAAGPLVRARARASRSAAPASTAWTTRPGAVTIHVYSPPIRSIGHYELVDGELRRDAVPARRGVAAEPALTASLAAADAAVSHARTARRDRAIVHRNAEPGTGRHARARPIAGAGMPSAFETVTHALKSTVCRRGARRGRERDVRHRGGDDVAAARVLDRHEQPELAGDVAQQRRAA